MNRVAFTPNWPARAAKVFQYRDLGTMATIGRNNAVAQIGPLKLSGFGGWLAWLLVHMARTVSLRVRSLVVASWISALCSPTARCA